jgi:TonB-dependent receptor
LTIATTFRQGNVTFAPNVTPTSIDPDNVQANPLNENLTSYTFNQQVRATNFAGERDIVGSADLRFNASNSDRVSTFLKAGFKFRDKDKTRTRDEVTLTPNGVTIPLSTALADSASHELLDGRYTFGPFMSLSTAADLPNRFPMNTAVNHARDSEDFEVGEQVASVYAMAELYVGSKLFVLPGVRYEHTSSDFAGNEVTFSSTGAWLATMPIFGGHDYGNVLPGVNVRYAVTPSANFRFAVTRSLARPNYIQLVPFRSLNDSDNTMALGNSDLRPTLSWNVDAMFEHYLKAVGVVSAGVFYKKLHDYIYTFTSTQTINSETFTVTQPLNGEDASIRGIELVAQSQLRFLPRPFDGFGVYANCTYTDSTAVFPGRSGEQSTLPGQSKNVGNLSVSYELSGFSARLSTNFHGSYVDQVAAAAGQDRFYDTHRQLDFSVSQRLTRNVRAFFDAINLTDAPLRYFQGVSDRPLQEEHYRAWFDFGVKVDWP